MENLKQTFIIAGIAFIILTGGTLLAYNHAKGRTGTLVFPGGITYLGPTPTQPQSSEHRAQSNKIPVATDAKWNIQKGKNFPYEFSYPSTLSLGVFPGDPFDSVTIFWGNTNPQENLLLRVEDLTKMPDMKQYINKSKKEYAQIWWKQYGWKGISDVSEFTNNKGLKGYRAKYVDSSGNIPYDNIFFVVSGRDNLVIWLTGKLLEPQVFDKIVDSVSWSR